MPMYLDCVNIEAGNLFGTEDAGGRPYVVKTTTLRKLVKPVIGKRLLQEQMLCQWIINRAQEVHAHCKNLQVDLAPRLRCGYLWETVVANTSLSKVPVGMSNTN